MSYLDTLRWVFIAVALGGIAGEASFLLADRVGSAGKVLGLDLDATKLMAARDEALARGLDNLEFREASLLEPWPVRDADLVLIRFVLTHVTNPELVLAHARAALAPQPASTTVFPFSGPIASSSAVVAGPTTRAITFIRDFPCSPPLMM